MRFLALPFCLISASAAWAQKDRVAIVEENGVVLSCPRGEEWKAKVEDVSFTDGSKAKAAFVEHKMEDLKIWVLVQADPDRKGFKPLKEIAESILEEPKKKDKAKVRKNAAAKFPGAGGPSAWYLEVEWEESNAKKVKREWLFIDKANQGLCRVMIDCPDDIHTKFQAQIQFVLAAMQVVKVKKK
ncbi:MAG: hypothetical protein HYY17_02755 [Planctomycetes bacterium]|nr:hypothetical protein [Planctomycetota bacterium]